MYLVLKKWILYTSCVKSNDFRFAPNAKYDFFLHIRYEILRQNWLLPKECLFSLASSWFAVLLSFFVVFGARLDSFAKLKSHWINKRSVENQDSKKKNCKCNMLYLCRCSQIIVIKWEKETRLHSYSNKLIWFSEFQLHVQIHCTLAMYEQVQKRMSFPLVGFVSLNVWFLWLK